MRLAISRVSGNPKKNQRSLKDQPFVVGTVSVVRIPALVCRACLEPQHRGRGRTAFGSAGQLGGVHARCSSGSNLPLSLPRFDGRPSHRVCLSDLTRSEGGADADGEGSPGDGDGDGDRLDTSHAGSSILRKPQVRFYSLSWDASGGLGVQPGSIVAPGRLCTFRRSGSSPYQVCLSTLP